MSATADPVAPAVIDLANPSQPQERAELDLSPKSYADAFRVGTDGETNSRSAEVAANAESTHEPEGYQLEANGVLDKNLVYEKHKPRGGDLLTSMKPNVGHDAKLKQSREMAPRRKEHRREPSELASGRRAGAGWEKSAYGFRQIARHDGN